MRNKKPIVISILIVYLIVFTVMIMLLFPSIKNIFAERYMVNEDNVIFIFVFLILTIICGLVALFFILLMDKTPGDYTKFYGSTTISGKQEYIENKISELNYRLVASEDKWKSAYHLLLSSQNRQIDTNGIISTSKFLGKFGIDINNISEKKDSAFVLMPFNSEYIDTFLSISNICMNLKIKAIRSDEEFVQSDILTHIIKCIVESRVIIAVIDGRNVNVFYELGIAHALNKPTILVSKVDSSIPFDIQGQYIILYNSFDELEKKLNDALLIMLTNDN